MSNMKRNKSISVLRDSNFINTIQYFTEPLRGATGLRISKTIYPDGKARNSLGGKHEWYGLQEGKKITHGNKTTKD